jgi:hypothetical protein
MAARTTLTPVQLVPDNGAGQGAGADIAGLAATGATVPFNIVLLLANSGAASADVIVRASRSGPDAAGNTQTNPPADVVFTRATIGPC